MRLRGITKRVQDCYLSAGTSALLLVYAHVHSELWFLAFFALVPFLSQLCRSSRREAPATGMMLATIYVLATGFGEIVTAPKVLLFKFLALNVVFGLLSMVITWLRSRLRFQPLMMALLTVPVSLLLFRWVNLEHLFQMMHAGPNLAISFCSLFSILLWSTVLVLGGSLVLVFARSVLGGICRLRKLRPRPSRRTLVLCDPIVRSRYFYCAPNPRAPPLVFSPIAP
jgi:hypothetical protein